MTKVSHFFMGNIKEETPFLLVELLEAVKVEIHKEDKTM